MLKTVENFDRKENRANRLNLNLKHMEKKSKLLISI